MQWAPHLEAALGPSQHSLQPSHPALPGSSSPRPSHKCPMDSPRPTAHQVPHVERMTIDQAYKDITMPPCALKTSSTLETSVALEISSTLKTSSALDTSLNTEISYTLMKCIGFQAESQAKCYVDPQSTTVIIQTEGTVFQTSPDFQNSLAPSSSPPSVDGAPGWSSPLAALLWPLSTATKATRAASSSSNRVSWTSSISGAR